MQHLRCNLMWWSRIMKCKLLTVCQHRLSLIWWIPKICNEYTESMTAIIYIGVIIMNCHGTPDDQMAFDATKWPKKCMRGLKFKEVYPFLANLRQRTQHSLSLLYSLHFNLLDVITGNVRVWGARARDYIRSHRRRNYAGRQRSVSSSPTLNRTETRKWVFSCSDATRTGISGVTTEGEGISDTTTIDDSSGLVSDRRRERRRRRQRRRRSDSDKEWKCGRLPEQRMVMFGDRGVANCNQMCWLLESHRIAAEVAPRRPSRPSAALAVRGSLQPVGQMLTTRLGVRPEQRRECEGTIRIFACLSPLRATGEVL